MHGDTRTILLRPLLGGRHHSHGRRHHHREQNSGHCRIPWQQRAGAFLPDGTQIPGAANDELENANNNATFVSRAVTSPGSANEFDDLVAWVPLPILMNRMVTAGRLP
jgi:hypothetical protein